LEHANFLETRATEYSKAATRGNWGEVWESLDRRQAAKTTTVANDADEGGDLLTGVAAE
jgi:ribonucleoside-diphosphate reductase beta chain